MKKPITLNQKETEKTYLDKFNELLPNFPSGEIHALLQNEEPPDFELGDISIEVTEVHLENLKKTESFQNRLREDMQTRYDQICNIPLSVSIEFSEDIRLKSNEKNKFIEETVELVCNEVQKNNIKNNERINIVCPDKKIEFITVWHFSRLEKSIWQCGKGMCIPNPLLDDIKKIIDKKNKLIGTYKKNYDLKWLLIVETGEPSSMYDDYTDICNYQYKSNFDRIFVLRYWSNTFIELKINKNSGCK